MVERMSREGAQFLNAHVFAGGQIDPSDNGNIRRAALRELYEEASIHLLPHSSSTIPRRVLPQSAPSSAKIPYSQYIEVGNEETAEDCLVPFSRWITPKFMKKRFDTTFFLAMGSDGIQIDGIADGTEIKSIAWFSPKEALEQFFQGKIVLFPPQWYILARR
jgi:8-oxo-dGTP pyrophosphatase MutT (NUDIX family)